MRELSRRPSYLTIRDPRPTLLSGAVAVAKELDLGDEPSAVFAVASIGARCPNRSTLLVVTKHICRHELPVALWTLQVGVVEDSDHDRGGNGRYHPSGRGFAASRSKNR